MIKVIFVMEYLAETTFIYIFNSRVIVSDFCPIFRTLLVVLSVFADVFYVSRKCKIRIILHLIIEYYISVKLETLCLFKLHILLITFGAKEKITS